MGFYLPAYTCQKLMPHRPATFSVFFRFQTLACYKYTLFSSRNPKHLSAAVKRKRVEKIDSFSSSAAEAAMSSVVAKSNLIASISRRGFSSASGAVSAIGRRSAVEEKMVKDGAHHVAEKASWVPDPVTGYYRPADRVVEMDPADLRNMLLLRKTA